MARVAKVLPRWLLSKAYGSSLSTPTFFRALSLAADDTKELQSDGPVPQMPPFDYTPQAYTGPKADEILAKRKQFLNPAMFLYYKKPVSHSNFDVYC